MKKITLFFAALALAFAANAEVDIPTNAGTAVVMMEDGANAGTEGEGFTPNAGGYAVINSNFSISASGNNTITDITTTKGFLTMKLRKVEGATFNPDYQIGIALNASSKKHKWSEWAAITGSNIPAEPTTSWQYAIFKIDPAYTTGEDPLSWIRVFIESGAAGVLEIEDIYISENQPDYAGDPGDPGDPGEPEPETKASIGWYNLESKTWETGTPAANQPFALALKITDTDLITKLDEATTGETINTVALGDLRIGNPPAVTEVKYGEAIRLYPIDKANHIYGLDMCISQMFAGKEVGTQLTDGSIIHFEFFVGQINGGGWWYQANYGYIAFGPADAAFDDVEDFKASDFPDKPNTGNNEFVGLAFPGAVTGGEVVPLPPVGLEDVVLEKGEPVAVEYYSLTGAKVSNPKGIVIKKSIFADGSFYVEKEVK